MRGWVGLYLAQADGGTPVLRPTLAVVCRRHGHCVNTARARRLCGNGEWGLRPGATTIDLNDVWALLRIPNPGLRSEFWLSLQVHPHRTGGRRFRRAGAVPIRGCPRHSAPQTPLMKKRQITRADAREVERRTHPGPPAPALMQRAPKATQASRRQSRCLPAPPPNSRHKQLTKKSVMLN
jgi:hypothetical protein